MPRALRTPSAVLDGEVCALDAEGRPSFSAMQQGSGRIVFYVFDVLEVDGDPLLDCTLEFRQGRLAELLDKRNQTVRISESFDEPGLLWCGSLSRVSARRLIARPSSFRGREADPSIRHQRAVAGTASV